MAIPFFNTEGVPRGGSDAWDGGPAGVVLLDDVFATATNVSSSYSNTGTSTSTYSDEATASGSYTGTTSSTGSYSLTAVASGAYSSSSSSSQTYVSSLKGIRFIGAASGVDSATLPAHEAGDVILCFAYRDGSTTAPSLPAGWTNITSVAGPTSSRRVGRIIALDSSTTSGTWTNATSVGFVVYRGVDYYTPTDGSTFSATQGTAASVTYPARTLTTLTDTWAVGMAGHRSTDTSLETAPSGMVNRLTSVDATDEIAIHDTNGPVASWSSTAVSVGGTASSWVSNTVELRARYAPTLSSPGVAGLGQNGGAPYVSTNKSGGTIYCVTVLDGDTPSAAQIKAGQNSSGAAAVKFGSSVVTSVSGSYEFASGGLTTGVAYDVWFIHEDTQGETSIPVKFDYTPAAHSAYTITTEWRNPSSNEGTAGWSSGTVSDVFASDDTRLSSTLAANDNPYIGLGTFGFSLPSNAIVYGVEIKVEGSQSATTDVQCFLKAGGLNGGGAFSSFSLPASEGSVIVGSPSYDFDRDWTVDDANLYLYAYLDFYNNGVDPVTIAIDNVQARFTYTVPLTSVSYSTSGSSSQTYAITADSSTSEVSYTSTSSSVNTYSPMYLAIYGYTNAGGTSTSTYTDNATTAGVYSNTSTSTSTYTDSAAATGSYTGSSSSTSTYAGAASALKGYSSASSSTSTYSNIADALAAYIASTTSTSTYAVDAGVSLTDIAYNGTTSSLCSYAALFGAIRSYSNTGTSTSTYTDQADAFKVYSASGTSTSTYVSGAAASSAYSTSTSSTSLYSTAAGAIRDLVFSVTETAAHAAALRLSTALAFTQAETEVLTTAVSRARTASFSITGAEVVSPSVRRTRAVQYALNEVQALTANVSRARSASATVNQTITIAAVIGKLKALAVGLTETMGVSAALTVARIKLLAYVVEQSQANTFLMNRARRVVMSATETEAIQTSFNRARPFISSVTENVAVISDFQRLREQVISINETQGTTAAITRLRGLVQAIEQWTGYTITLTNFAPETIPDELHITVSWEQWDVIGTGVNRVFRLNPRTEQIILKTKQSIGS